VVGWKDWLCCPYGPRPPRCSTEGACQSLFQRRHQGGSSSVALSLVVESIVCAVVAAPMGSPASVSIDSRCPAPPVDCRVGQ
jgi:hypothetical protein